jgi:AcrR family transcriptional regulator
MMAAGGSASAATADSPPRPSGRPRDPDVDAAILGAALQLLAEVGYQEMSIATIASTAGVGRPAIYRRYRSKADVVVDAILHVTDRPEPDLPSDSRRALRVLLGAASGAVTTPGGMAVLGSLLAEQRRDPELLAAFRARILDPRRAIVHRVLEQGIDAGEITPDADREAIDGLLFGALLARSILGQPVDDAWIDRVLEQTWRGVAAADARDTSR